MSTENNLDKTFNSSVKILSDLIAFKSISGEDNNSIINYCEKIFNDTATTEIYTILFVGSVRVYKRQTGNGVSN